MTNNKNLNWLDRTIGFFDPKSAYERAAWRQGLRNYDSGSSERRNSGWVVSNNPAEKTNQAQRDIIRARARDLERNSDIAEAIISAYERNVVCTGLKLQAKVLKEDGTEDESLNQQIEELWKDWCRARNCEITGQQSFAQLQAMIIRRILVDGGILFIKSYNTSGPVPLVLQAREVDDIDTSLVNITKSNKNRIINGIEVDQYNKPIAYYLKTTTPDGLWDGKTERITADRVIFLHDKIRPSQIREISKLAKTASRIRDVNEYIDAISMKERILACLTVFIKKITPTGMGRSKIDEKTDLPITKIAPGMVNQLEPGDDVQVVNPAGQSSNARDFISIQQRLAGSSQGLSYEAVSRDMSQVNYSSARQGLLEDQRTYTIWQLFLIEQFCYEVYIAFLISAVLAGKLDIKDFWKNKARYTRHDWITPGWSWIDPLKEAKANEIALATGQTTLAQICASSGQEWQEVIKQRAKEQKEAEKLGVNLGVNTNANVTETETSDGDSTEKDVSA